MPYRNTQSARQWHEALLCWLSEPRHGSVLSGTGQASPVSRAHKTSRVRLRVASDVFRQLYVAVKDRAACDHTSSPLRTLTCRTLTIGEQSGRSGGVRALLDVESCTVARADHPSSSPGPAGLQPVRAALALAEISPQKLPARLPTHQPQRNMTSTLIIHLTAMRAGLRSVGSCRIGMACWRARRRICRSELTHPPPLARLTINRTDDPRPAARRDRRACTER